MALSNADLRNRLANGLGTRGPNTSSTPVTSWGFGAAVPQQTDEIRYGNREPSATRPRRLPTLTGYKGTGNFNVVRPEEEAPPPDTTVPTPEAPISVPSSITAPTPRNPSYVGNIGLGGFSQFDERRTGGASAYEMADASTDRTNPATVAGEMMEGDSRLMRAAAARGTQAANRRGLVNSSMAVGAAQDAVLDEIVPLAAQEAGQRFESNRARQDFGLGSLLSRQEFEQRLSENEQGFGFDLGLLNREGEINMGRDRANFGYERDLEELRLRFAGDQAALDRAFDRESQLIDVSARFDLADMDANVRRELLQMERDMRVELQRMETAFDGNNIATEAYLTARDQYNQRVTNILNNQNMSAEERADAIMSEQENLLVDVRAIEDLYGVDLPWTQDYQPQTGESAVYQEVARAYQEVLNRSPDTAGSNFWTQQILSGNATINDVRNALRESPEGRGEVRYSSTTGQLTPANQTQQTTTGGTSRISEEERAQMRAEQTLRADLRSVYFEELNRLPDSQGYNFWLRQIQSGNMTLDDVRRALRDSPEGRGEMVYDRETRRLVPA